MPVFYLLPQHEFPSTSLADEDGLLAFEDTLRLERLLEAYSKGIFPWYNEGEPVQWWSPDPRFVLFPDSLKISKSMRSMLKNPRFHFKINHDFKAVIEHCRDAKRPGQDGTWIGEDIVRHYTSLHEKGIAHCAACYEGETLLGGLYGVRLGNVFFGESMFSRIPNASKYAFINYVHFLKQDGVELIDCQVYTEHLERLGATFIDRAYFESFLVQ